VKTTSAFTGTILAVAFAVSVSAQMLNHKDMRWRPR
jgi:predicted outer membrane lipoprotein